MSNVNAIRIGGLANKPAFFGTTSAEIVSVVAAGRDVSWNGDMADFVNSTNPWFYRGGAHAQDGSQAGVFASHPRTGDSSQYWTSHRTILLGY
ncbi:hypothetical protein FWG76_00105 [Candidatus Saccharibacteria bacterium]|nr:hypothetical protein [Candidatus Saccharibacteria bacterium]